MIGKAIGLGGRHCLMQDLVKRNRNKRIEARPTISSTK